MGLLFLVCILVLALCIAEGGDAHCTLSVCANTDCVDGCWTCPHQPQLCASGYVVTGLTETRSGGKRCETQSRYTCVSASSNGIAVSQVLYVFNVSNSGSVAVKALVDYKLEAGANQTSGSKYISSMYASSMPVSSVEVRDENNTVLSHTVAGPTFGQTMVNYQFDEPVLGPRRHRLTISFQMTKGVCVTTQALPAGAATAHRNPKRVARLPAKWTSFWDDPVHVSYFFIALPRGRELINPCLEDYYGLSFCSALQPGFTNMSGILGTNNVGIRFGGVPAVKTFTWQWQDSDPFPTLDAEDDSCPGDPEPKHYETGLNAAEVSAIVISCVLCCGCCCSLCVFLNRKSLLRQRSYHGKAEHGDAHSGGAHHEGTHGGGAPDSV